MALNYYESNIWPITYYSVDYLRFITINNDCIVRYDSIRILDDIQLRCLCTDFQKKPIPSENIGV